MADRWITEGKWRADGGVMKGVGGLTEGKQRADIGLNEGCLSADKG
jgi:hypothetical protein